MAKKPSKKSRVLLTQSGQPVLEEGTPLLVKRPDHSPYIMTPDEEFGDQKLRKRLEKLLQEMLDPDEMRSVEDILLYLDFLHRKLRYRNLYMPAIRENLKLDAPNKDLRVYEEQAKGYRLTYGRLELEQTYTDEQWGALIGKISAFRWVLGSDIDFLSY